jgi:hypothetical protein
MLSTGLEGNCNVLYMYYMRVPSLSGEAEENYKESQIVQLIIRQ